MSLARPTAAAHNGTVLARGVPSFPSSGVDRDVDSTADRRNAPHAAQVGSSELKERVRALRLPKEAAVPPARTGIAAVLLILVLGAATAYLGYRQFFTSSNADSPPQAALPQPARQVAEKTTGDTVSEGSLALEAKGYIIPARQVVVSPKVSGMIEELFIVEGQRVQKGTILAELEKTDYQADAERERRAETRQSSAMKNSSVVSVPKRSSRHARNWLKHKFN